MGIGVFLFSASCVVMGFTSDFWQLVVLRMGIALGEAVCRPAASSLIAEKFGWDPFHFKLRVLLSLVISSPESRGVATGIFSWGVYFGYGLAYIYGKYLTQADILGEGWRASYVIGGAPGVVIALAMLFTLRYTQPYTVFWKKKPNLQETKKFE